MRVHLGRKSMLLCAHLIAVCSWGRLGCSYSGALTHSAAKNALLSPGAHKHSVSLARYQGVARAVASVQLRFGT